MSNDYFLVKGLNKERKLSGKIRINGAKNAVLKVISSSVLFKGDLHISNVPETDDVRKLLEILENLGATFSWELGDKNNLVINTDGINKVEFPRDLSQSMRSSVVLTGPMLARFGKVIFPSPGGCVIGSRPIDLFLNAYERMGASVEYTKEAFVITAPNEKKLIGNDIFFNLQTVTGTETIMMAAVLAKGKTILKNCAMEPETVSLGEFLVSCGADIKGLGTTTIEINGGGLLKPSKEYVTIPDRIEAGSFLLLGSLLAKKMTIEDCEPRHLESLTNLLFASGVSMEIGKDYITVNGDKCSKELKSFNFRTHEYPGFPTDLQAPAVTYLTAVSGDSIVFETIYESRLKYVEDLIKLGADITVMNPREIMVHGGNPLKAVKDDELRSHDLRAGFAVVFAALLAEGDSKITGIKFIDRGYERLEERLNVLGADIMRVKSE